MNTRDRKDSPKHHMQPAAILIVFCLVFSASLIAQQTASYVPVCEAKPMIGSNSFKDLSSAYFGDSSYQWSILLATNAHASDSGFKFIRDPYHPPTDSTACIPLFPEANHLRSSYDRYLRSVNQTRMPTPTDISSSLVAIDSSKPATVVTWIRESQLSAFRKGTNTWISAAPYDVWVTAVPKLKDFCQEFANKHVASVRQLTERLEERLGLPPLNGKTVFVEFTVTDPSVPTHLFRPCVVPSVTTTSCALGPPPSEAGDQYKGWFFSQYYSSYGTQLPYPYPWTSLGYTFDWAQLDDDHSTRFVQFGESEFVVPKGAPIQIKSASTIMQYCSVRETAPIN